MEFFSLSRRNSMRSTHRLGRRRKTESGQASLEILLSLLILVPLFFGAVELARGVGIWLSLNSDVAVAARALALDPTQWDWSVQIIQDGLQNNVLGGGAVDTPTVQVFNSAGSELTSSQLASLGFGEPFRLQASTTFRPLIPLVGGQNVVIRVSHWDIVERYP